MQIDAAKATEALRAEAANAHILEPILPWATKFEKLDILCGKIARTHIAALGTALLAKSVDVNVDVFALKLERNGPRAYSARSLAKDVLAALAPELEIDIGVYGREPLNNQPYFREAKIHREMPIRSNARPALEFLIGLLEQVDKIATVDEARAVLRTYISVRRTHFRRPTAVVAPGQISPSELAFRIESLISERSEGGKRAQAVVAGLIDAAVGPDRVQTGRVNDPDRSLPGDVGVLFADGSPGWLRVFEVRDKPVTEADLHHFYTKVATATARRAAMIALSPSQPDLDTSSASQRADAHNVTLAYIQGCRDLVSAAIYWSDGPRETFGATAFQRIDARLIELDAAPSTVSDWRRINLATPA